MPDGQRADWHSQARLPGGGGREVSVSKRAPHAIDVISNEPGAKTFNVPNGGTAVQNSSSPTKAYAIEVSDPGPAKALDLVESGDIQPVR